MTRKRAIVLTCLLAAAAAGPVYFLVDAARESAAKERVVAIAAALESPGPGLGGLAVAYPGEGAVFPPDIAAPTIRWRDATPGVEAWHVGIFSGADHVPVIGTTTDSSWRPTERQWAYVAREARGASVQIVVAGVSRPKSTKLLSKTGTTVEVSNDEVGAAIFFRDVPLPFIYALRNTQAIRWRVADIGTRGPAPVVMSGLPVCANCHSFSRDFKTIGMDVDYGNDKGSYVITSFGSETVLSADRVITWSDYRRSDGEPTFGLLSALSPDGRYAVSTVKDRSVFVPVNGLEYSQLFFPIKGILAVHDREMGTFSALPGADDPTYVQSNPTWTPDGRNIIFARAEAIELPGMSATTSVLLPAGLAKDFIEGKRGCQFDLYRIPFDDGRGGQAEPVPGASANGMSNYFPRVSPDGKWIVFCRARNFMLLQPDSELYIIPATGGEPRRMACNTDNMNSWHSWSPNSRWLVFSSKTRGPYTRLLLTHIDEDGNDSAPVVLEDWLPPDRAANIPEFVRLPPDGCAMVARFLNDQSFVREGDNVASSFRDYEKAAQHFRTATEINPDNAKAHSRLGLACMELGRNDEAVRALQNAVRLDPTDIEARLSLGVVFSRMGRDGEAKQVFEAVLRDAPDNAEAHINMGSALATGGDIPGGRKHFAKAVELAPEHPSARLSLGEALAAERRTAEAQEQFRAALRCAQRDPGDAMFVAERLLARGGHTQGVVTMLRAVTKAQPYCGPAHLLLFRIAIETGDLDGATTAFESLEAIRPPPPWLRAKLDELREKSHR